MASRLAALMKDHCDKLQAQGVLAVELHSGLAVAARTAAVEAIASGGAGVELVTPAPLAEPVRCVGPARRPCSR